MTRRADDTAPEQRGRPFKPGQSGNPTGRPKGSRSKLGEQFLADMFDDWQENGAASIVAMREKDPVAYVKVVASILPKELKIGSNDMDSMTNEQLFARIRQLDEAIREAFDLEDTPDNEATDSDTSPAVGEPIH